MARALVVGCGCRGRELATRLVADGHAVRGTTRDGSRLAAIESAGAEAVIADPNRLATLIPQIEGVALLFWLMGSAAGEPEAVAALHGPRLESLLEALVDTPVRGVVYEAAGSVRGEWLEQGAEIARRASATYRLPLELLTRDPADHGAWRAQGLAAAGRLLSP